MTFADKLKALRENYGKYGRADNGALGTLIHKQNAEHLFEYILFLVNHAEELEALVRAAENSRSDGAGHWELRNALAALNKEKT